jgi:protein gp37
LPLKWKSPKRIFVNSLSDLFHEALPDEAIDRVFAVMALCEQHTFQILTKRPDRMLLWFSAERPAILDRLFLAGKMPDRWWGSHINFIQSDGLRNWPLSNCWLGVSVENQATADTRIPLLLKTPAAVRFVSYEPALSGVDLTRYLSLGLDLVIVGGESGPGARPFDIEWVRQTIEQCKAAGVACFVKQLGAVPMLPANGLVYYCDGSDWPEGTRFGNRTGDREFNGRQILLKDRKGGDWDEWPSDLRVREFPAAVLA